MAGVFNFSGEGFGVARADGVVGEGVGMEKFRDVGEGEFVETSRGRYDDA